MTRAITTWYIGPGLKRGSRYKALGAKREGDRPEISLTDGAHQTEHFPSNHARVAKLLATRMNWAGLYVAGDLPASDGSQVFVCVIEGHLPMDVERIAYIAQALMLSAKREGRDFFIVRDTKEGAKSC